MVELYQNICGSFGINSSFLLSKQYKVLDCPSGASSFVAQANRLGAEVVGCDPLFSTSLKKLAKRGKEDVDKVIEKVKLALNLYKWDFYKSIQGLQEYRTQALMRF